jgi:hypothetical protein
LLSPAGPSTGRASHHERSLGEKTPGGDGPDFPRELRLPRAVVENLLSNAFKYGAADLPVVLRTVGVDGGVRLEVITEATPSARISPPTCSS